MRQLCPDCFKHFATLSAKRCSGASSGRMVVFFVVTRWRTRWRLKYLLDLVCIGTEPGPSDMVRGSLIAANRPAEGGLTAPRLLVLIRPNAPGAAFSPKLKIREWVCDPVPDVRSSGSVEGAHAGLELHRNITGRIVAGTPIAVQPAGTLLITSELAATVASSPIVTAPITLAWHPIKTWSPMTAPPGRGPAPMVHAPWIAQSAPILV